MKRANIDIRQAAKSAGVPLWQIASKFPMHEATFSRKLRYELSLEDKHRVYGIIAELKQEAERELKLEREGA